MGTHDGRSHEALLSWDAWKIIGRGKIHGKKNDGSRTPASSWVDLQTQSFSKTSASWLAFLGEDVAGQDPPRREAARSRPILG